MTLLLVVETVSTPSDQLPTVNSVTLQWSALMSPGGDEYRYEVGYSARPDDTQCTDSVDTLPDGYTLFGNTTGTSIVVTGLEPGTCYVFGVRVYALKTKESGEWTTVLLKTKTSKFCFDTNDELLLFMADLIVSKDISNNIDGPNVGAIAGGITVGLILLVIVAIVLLLATLLMIRYIHKCSSKNTNFDFVMEKIGEEISEKIQNAVKHQIYILWIVMHMKALLRVSYNYFYYGITIHVTSIILIR